MNIYEKLNKIRQELLERKLKKSGVNKFAGFDYYQLEDLIPSIIELENKYGVFSEFDLGSEMAVLTMTNTEKIDEKLEFTSPVDTLTLKGTNQIQNIGGTHTYLRRYLYLNAYNIVEPDLFDATSGKETPKKATYKEVSSEDLKEAKDNGFVETISSDDWNNLRSRITKVNDLDKAKKLNDWVCKQYNIKSLATLPKEKLHEVGELIDSCVNKALSKKETI